MNSMSLGFKCNLDTSLLRKTREHLKTSRSDAWDVVNYLMHGRLGCLPVSSSPAAAPMPHFIYERDAPLGSPGLLSS